MTMRRRNLLSLLPMPFIARGALARDLAGDLRHGGYVIYMRHAETDTKAEPAVGEIKDCLWQRNLTPAGKAQAVAAGKALKDRGVRYGQVASSAFCHSVV